MAIEYNLRIKSRPFFPEIKHRLNRRLWGLKTKKHHHQMPYFELCQQTKKHASEEETSWPIHIAYVN